MYALHSSGAFSFHLSSLSLARALSPCLLPTRVECVAVLLSCVSACLSPVRCAHTCIRCTGVPVTKHASTQEATTTSQTYPAARPLLVLFPLILVFSSPFRLCRAFSVVYCCLKLPAESPSHTASTPHPSAAKQDTVCVCVCALAAKKQPKALAPANPHSHAPLPPPTTC